MLPDVSKEDLQRIGGLTGDRGYTLLMDYIQAVLDGYLTRLSEPTLPDAESLKLLQHWRGLREIHAVLMTTPQFYAQQASVTPDSPDETAVPPTFPKHFDGTGPEYKVRW